MSQSVPNSSLAAAAVADSRNQAEAGATCASGAPPPGAGLRRAAAALLGVNVSRITISETKQLEQSDIALLHYDDDDSTALLLKCTDLAQLRLRLDKTEAKWRVSLLSFQNEAQFFRGAPLERLSAEGVRIPRIEQCSVESPGTLDVRVTTIMEYLGPEHWRQFPLFDLPHATNALASLALFHVSLAMDAVRNEAWLRPLFAPGAWWRKPLRPSVVYSEAEAAFSNLCEQFPSEFAAIDSAANRFGIRQLAAHVEELTAALSRGPFCAVVHGDPKTSNLFWPIGAQDDPTPTPALIDFQWTGPARSGFADVAYLLLGSVHCETLRAHEEELLESYLRAACAAAAALGCVEQLPWLLEPAWRREWELEQAAFIVTALPQLLRHITPAEMKANVGRYGYLSHELDPAAAALLCRRGADIGGRISELLLPQVP